jgi:hypothetical protein
MSRSSDDKNNITKEGVSNDYSSAIKNGDKSQQIPTENIKSIALCYHTYMIIIGLVTYV